MSELFPHRVLPAKTDGFVFVVVPEDEELAEHADTAEKILNDWFEKESTSGLSPKDAQNPEEVDMVYADAITLLEEKDFPLYDCFIVTSVTVVGNLVLVLATLGIFGEEDEEDVEDDDESFQ